MKHAKFRNCLSAPPHSTFRSTRLTTTPSLFRFSQGSKRSLRILNPMGSNPLPPHIISTDRGTWNEPPESLAGRSAAPRVDVQPTGDPANEDSLARRSYIPRGHSHRRLLARASSTSSLPPATRASNICRQSTAGTPTQAVGHRPPLLMMGPKKISPRLFTSNRTTVVQET